MLLSTYPTAPPPPKPGPSSNRFEPDPRRRLPRSLQPSFPRRFLNQPRFVDSSIRLRVTHPPRPSPCNAFQRIERNERIERKSAFLPLSSPELLSAPSLPAPRPSDPSLPRPLQRIPLPLQRNRSKPIRRTPNRPPIPAPSITGVRFSPCATGPASVLPRPHFGSDRLCTTLTDSPEIAHLLASGGRKSPVSRRDFRFVIPSAS